MDVAGGILDADDQHVLCQPALVVRLVAGNAQGVAFLAEQGVAAVAGAVRLDRQFRREMHDPAPLGVQFADGMQALDEAPLALDPRQRGRAHARHDAHVGHHVGAVGDLHAATRQRRIDRPHAVGNDVHRAPGHAAVEQRVDLCVRGGRVHPVVVGAGILLARMAHQREPLHARHIGGIGAVQVATGVGLLVEFEQRAGLQHLLYQRVIFRLRAIAPVHVVWPRQRSDLVDPCTQCLQLARHGSRSRTLLHKSPNVSLRVGPLQGRAQQLARCASGPRESARRSCVRRNRRTRRG